jgi:hypothetical protein
MKMPPVEIGPSVLGDEYVEFRTACGRVAGVALRRSGCGETHYDIVGARCVDAAVRPSMTPVEGIPAAFDVVGTVDFLFDDGLAVVAVHGFDFWIAPDEIAATPALGDRVACRVEKLTLYV